MLRRTCSFVAAAALATACFVSTPSAFAGREFPDSVHYTDAQESEKQGLDKLLGKPAPALQVTGWRGKEVSAADMKGKVVIVDIWATWCPPCIAAIPHNNELMEKYGNDGLLVVGVCSANGQEKMEKVAESKGMAYPTAKDPGNKTAEAYGVQFFPTYIAIDRKGVVRAVGLRPDGVEEVAKKLLAEKA